ncbi:MAG: hypothetical protein ACK4UN_03280 [Limisphaerales bacterium]
MFKWILGVSALAAMQSSSGPLLLAQSYAINWSRIASGGGTSSGGNFSVSGTIGQSDVGRITGGNFRIESGYWSVLSAVQMPGAPILSIKVMDGTVYLTWPGDAPGYVVEQASAVDGEKWSSVAETPSLKDGMYAVTLLVTGGNQFFRLVKP